MGRGGVGGDQLADKSAIVLSHCPSDRIKPTACTQDRTCLEIEIEKTDR